MRSNHLVIAGSLVVVLLLANLLHAQRGRPPQRPAPPAEIDGKPPGRGVEGGIPQRVSGPWQITDYYLSPIAPSNISTPFSEKKPGNIASLGPAKLKVQLSPEGFLWVTIRYSQATAKKDLARFTLVDASGATHGELFAWIDAATVGRERDRVVYEYAPWMAKLKDQDAVKRFKDLAEGRSLRDGQEALLVFQGEWESLETLSLKGDGTVRALKPAEPAVAQPGAEPSEPEPADEPVEPEPRPAAVKRTWRDVSGQHAIVAELVNFDGRNVRLRKEDGQILEVPLDKLSTSDQRFLEELHDNGAFR